MAQQIRTYEIQQVDIPAGMELEPNLTPETMRQSIDATMEGFISLIRTKLEQIEGKLTIIFPMDGSFIPFYEFKRSLSQFEDAPTILSKLNFVFAAKEYDDAGKYEYVLSRNLTAEDDVIILDDIYDSGDSSQKIKKVIGSLDDKFQVVSLTTKEGKGFNQGNIPIHTYRDQWVASGFGMDCGKFSVRVVMEAIEKDQIDGRDGQKFFELHKEVEVLERMCGVSFLINNGKTVEDWRFNVDAVKKYIAVLKTNCLYKGMEFDEVYTALRAIQDRSGADKFQIFAVEA